MRFILMGMMVSESESERVSLREIALVSVAPSGRA